jgi:hypothetical protein
MQQGTRWVIALLITVAVALSGCAQATNEKATKPAPAKVERIKGSDVQRLLLTKEAVRRIGIETAPVLERAPSGAGPQRRLVPYGALIYDPSGAASVYTNPEPLTYVRAPVTVEGVVGEQAVLTDGPPPGTAVVTVGAAELFGVDSGIGGNE